MTGARALEGLRVLDLTRYIPGPYCTMLLGDLGADVVKVEEPGIGDATRVLPPAVGGESAVHAALNRNKRSLVVDIRQDEGARAVRRVAEQADVLVEGFRPGVLDRRGLGYPELSGRNPRLVYCSLTGYGQDGPRAGRAGHDVNYLARSGILAGLAGADGSPPLPSTQLADMTGGLLALAAILAALQARERSGRGQRVDVSLLSGSLALQVVPAARLLAGGTGQGELQGRFACYNVYRCADGKHLAVGALEPKFWEALVRALGLDELAGRQWQGPARARETVARVAAAFATRTRDEWIRAFAEHDACVEPVLELDEALGQPEAARDLVERRHGDEACAALGLPFRLEATPADYRRPAPALGQHTEEVLGEIGYTPQEISRLRENGVVA
jgi:crotonobetainyl-CoA:carnitine CoA-transferase CaiB-like acyl-CoA transferase